MISYGMNMKNKKGKIDCLSLFLVLLILYFKDNLQGFLYQIFFRKSKLV